MGKATGVSLGIIDVQAMRAATNEFDDLGRVRFLKRYGVSRSSKFYLMKAQRLYDTKALVASAYQHATGKKLRNTDFAGGAQTRAVFRNLAHHASEFEDFFEDKLGELSNLSSEYDRIPRAWNDLREIGFSKWIPLTRYRDLKTNKLPGVYVIANSSRQPRKNIIDERVVYIGETVSQNLGKRLYQLNHALDGKGGHSGGTRLREKGYHSKKLWLSIRSFPLGRELFATRFRAAQIRLLERMLLYKYADTHDAYPDGNEK